MGDSLPPSTPAEGLCVPDAAAAAGAAGTGASSIVVSAPSALQRANVAAANTGVS